MDLLDNTENIEMLFNELQQTDKEKYTKLVNFLEICHQKYLDMNKPVVDINSTKSKALKCFDSSVFAKNEELRKLFDDIQILDFVKYNNSTDSSIVKDIVVILGNLKFEVVFHGKMRGTEYKGTLNVSIQQANCKQISGTANSIVYKAGQPIAFMVPISLSAQNQPNQPLAVTRDYCGPPATIAAIDMEFFNAMHFKLTSKLMFCYFIDFIISDLIKELVE